jgi:hypothetical protein
MKCNTWDSIKNIFVVKDTGRFIFAIIYFIIGLLIIFLMPKLFNYNYFYIISKNDFNNFPRLIWCIAFSFIGFSALAYEASKSEHKDEKNNGEKEKEVKSKKAIYSYLYYYPIILIANSSFIFGIFHIFKETSNYLFYFLSASCAVYLSFQVDHIRTLIYELLSKSSRK